MADPILVTDTVVVPAHALLVRAVRSSGPGGQHVNKVASRIELHVDLEAITGLPAAARARLARLTAARRDAQGRLLVTSQRTRDQARNLEDARSKVRAVVAKALVEPKRRRPTRPTAAARERRLGSKKRRGELKRGRSDGPDD